MKESNTEIKNTKYANAVLKENVVNRLSNIHAYQDARKDALAFNKQEGLVVAISAVVSIAITAGVVYKKNSSFPIVELIDTWFIVAAAILAVLFVVALFSRKELTVRIEPVKNIAIESEDVLKSYFVDFVKEQVTLDNDQDCGLDRVSEFKVTTKSDNKRLRERDLVISGFCHYKENVVEQSIKLGFTEDYGMLVVKNHDKVVAVRESSGLSSSTT